MNEHFIHEYDYYIIDGLKISDIHLVPNRKGIYLCFVIIL